MMWNRYLFLCVYIYTHRWDICVCLSVCHPYRTAVSIEVHWCTRSPDVVDISALIQLYGQRVYHWWHIWVPLPTSERTCYMYIYIHYFFSVESNSKDRYTMIQMKKNKFVNNSTRGSLKTKWEKKILYLTYKNSIFPRLPTHILFLSFLDKKKV